MTSDNPPKFHVAQEVVCTVDLSQWAFDGQQPPRPNELVTITAVLAIQGVWAVSCAGYPPKELYDEDGFAPVLPAEQLAEQLAELLSEALEGVAV